jgi:23S rRNA pseudouridine2604 synthase
MLAPRPSLKMPLNEAMTMRKTYSGADPVRVNKWLAQEGVCSRREAESLIADGHIRIDGEVVADPGRKIAPGQTLTIGQAGAKELASAVTVVINKPIGIVSAQPEGAQIPAARLLTKAALWGPAKLEPDPRWSLAPLGRLDQDSRGLLILSQDGVLTKAVIGPESKVDKEYIVDVAGQITPQKVKLLRHGLTLDNRALKPAKIDLLAPQRLRFTLVEGRNRQIRRMCELVGLMVVDLLRVRIGPLHLGELPEGRWRPMAPDERAGLIRAAGPR